VALTLLTDELNAPNGLRVLTRREDALRAQSDPEKSIWMAYP
jgi:hypothetical protein